MGIINAEKLYTGHPDFKDVCIGYDADLCCDCCGEEYDQEELYRIDNQMLCKNCILSDEKEYSTKNKIFDENNDVVNYCMFCGCKNKKLYIYTDAAQEETVACGDCLAENKYAKVSDDDVSRELSSYLDS